MKQSKSNLIKCLAFLLVMFLVPTLAMAEEISVGEKMNDFFGSMGFAQLEGNWLCLVMIAVSLVLFYLAIVKKFEPLLLLPIAFGMLLTNLPGAGL